jgi:outer membrane receptor protein involved in Fe transport
LERPRGAIRPAPLIEDDSVNSLSSLIFNARAGYRFDNGLKLQLDVLNLFNADQPD